MLAFSASITPPDQHRGSTAIKQGNARAHRRLRSPAKYESPVSSVPAAVHRWLLLKVAKARQFFRSMNEEELEFITQAGMSCLGIVDRLLLFTLFKVDDNIHMMNWLSWK